MIQQGGPGFGRVRGELVRGLGIVVTLVLAAPPAMASNRQVQERAARKACLSGDYNKGIEILADLFVETQNAIYIFNQGRCFEQNQQYKEAIARFQEFLRTDAVRALRPDDKASAEKHIASCKESLAEQASLAPLSPAPVVAAPTPAPAFAPVTIVQTEPSSAPANPGSGLRITGIVLASVGVAALGAGLGLNLLANKKISDMESKADGYSDGESSNQKTFVNLAWVGYGVGAACLATGAILYGVGFSARSKPSGKVSLVPTFGPGQAGAAFVGAF